MDSPYTHPDVQRMRQIYETAIFNLMAGSNTVSIVIPAQRLKGMPPEIAQQVADGLGPGFEGDAIFHIIGSSQQDGEYRYVARVEAESDDDAFEKEYAIKQYELAHLLEKSAEVRCHNTPVTVEEKYSREQILDMGLYAYVPWPGSQDYMEEDWFNDEAILDNSEEADGSCYLIPIERIPDILS